MNAKINVSADVARAVREKGLDPDEILRAAITAAAAAPVAEPEPTGWTRQGVILPNGTKLRAWHKDRAWWAEIAGGRIVWKGQEFDAPSQAAQAIAGRPMNGWEFWEAHVPGVKGWSTLTSLRPKRH